MRPRELYRIGDRRIFTTARKCCSITPVPAGRARTTLRSNDLNRKGLFLLIHILLASACGRSSAEFTATERTLLRNTPFEIPAGEWVVIGRIVFVEQGNSRNQRFTGSVQAASPLNLLILEQPDFLNFEANQAFETTFDSGQSTSITFDIPVDPGGYQFVIDNRGSTTPVNITATIVLAQEEVIDPNILGPQL